MDHLMTNIIATISLVLNFGIGVYVGMTRSDIRSIKERLTRIEHYHDSEKLEEHHGT